MEIKLKLNGKQIVDLIEPDMLLLDFCRKHHCKSVKRGCETSNCGLCTVWLDGTPVLSCNVLAARAAGHEVTTLEGLQEEAREFGMVLAREGGAQQAGPRAGVRVAGGDSERGGAGGRHAPAAR